MAGHISLLQTFVYTSPTGPKPAQSISHPHDAILDPTGDFIVVLHFGSDLLRNYSFDKAVSLLTEIDHIPCPSGSHPRHGLFWALTATFTRGDLVFLYILAEFDSTITSIRVTCLFTGIIAL